MEVGTIENDEVKAKVVCGMPSIWELISLRLKSATILSRPNPFLLLDEGNHSGQKLEHLP